MRLFALLLLAMSVSTLALAAPSEASAPAPSFADFDQRARRGERLSVVFFGASLTWGANASDPQLTSYRAGISRHLEEHYPRAHFRFWDAAIGGTTSQLGAFRFERDVARRHPDLVFLDFSINDDPLGTDEDHLAAYEALVRRCLLETRCPVMQALLCNALEAGHPDLPLPRVEAHRRIAQAYGSGVGDAITFIRQRVASGQNTLGELWPVATDQTHPGDTGYALYAQAVWNGFLQAVREHRTGHVPPTMLYSDTYMTPQRRRLSQEGALPTGWRVDRPNRTSAWYDALMSRWLDDEVVAARDKAPTSAQPAPWVVRFHGQMALLFGESTLISGKYHALVDGRPAAESDEPDGVWNASALPYGGNMHHVRILAQGLDARREHTLEIVPMLEPGQELRLESLCVTGAR